MWKGACGDFHYRFRADPKYTTDRPQNAIFRPVYEEMATWETAGRGGKRARGAWTRDDRLKLKIHSLRPSSPMTCIQEVSGRIKSR